MKFAIVAFGLLLSTYLGYVVGLSAYCDEVPELRRAKKEVWIVPLYLVIYPMFLLFADGIEDRMEAIMDFFRLPEKGAFFISVLGMLRTEERKKERNRTRSYKVRRKEYSLNWPNIKELFYASNVAIS